MHVRTCARASPHGHGMCIARATHRSGDFMITGDNGAQDAMLDCALAAGKALRLAVHGRMLGGGGGGNVLLFVDRTGTPCM